ncbi:MAG: hypothetical protein KDA93_20120, partial [Planctomycetaceae bacterium]|nr:hypothetical protein [Planctomycetaceae bacterium]
DQFFKGRPDGPRAIISTELREIRSEREAYPSSFDGFIGNASMSLETRHGFEFPRNAVIEPRDTPDNVSGLCASKFASEGFEFFIFPRRDGGVCIDVTCPGPNLPPDLEMRVVESLQSVLGVEINWSVMRTLEMRTESVLVRSPTKGLGNASVKPPVAIDFIDHEDRVWKLFDAYFRFVVSNGPNRAWHPISRSLYSVLEGAAGSTDGEWMALGIAVEGLTKFVPASLCEETELNQAVINDFKETLAEWKPAPTDEEPDVERIRMRVTGLLNSLSRPVPKSVLLNLQGAGLIEANEISAWSKHRNTYAHSCHRLELPTQEELDRAELVRTLLHKLLFLTIGYSGEYTSYSERGYPFRAFPPPPSPIG